MDFTEFALHEELLKGIQAAGYVTCTPVQEQVLNASQQGADLYVQSQTGTGKTAAYLVSIIQEMLSKSENGAKALILVPTRELAVQVEEEAKTLLSASKLFARSFYGGVGYDKQVSALKKGVDIIIGTPGRVIDLEQGGQMDLSGVAYLVIDEADRMFDMGFYPDLRTLLKVLPQSEKRQTMLFSATLNSYVKNLAWEYTRDAKEITIEAENITVEDIDQELLHVSSDEKNRLLIGLLNSEKPSSVMIFCNTKKMCEVLSKRLEINGIKSEFIIGDLPQKKRLAVLNDFKAGKVNVLVATDVAARGIDVNDLAMVINYDLPNEAENYVHRIGRTARAGKTGKAYTFCSEQDVYSLPAIERYIEKSIPSRVADESMYAEDKSRDVYIRVQNWREDYDDKSDFGSRRAEEKRGRRGGRRRRGERALDMERVRKTAQSVSQAAGAFAASEEIAGDGFQGAKKKRGAGRYSERNRAKASEYKRDRRVKSVERNPEEEAKMAQMSFDERMKFYKEKYGTAISEPSKQPQAVSQSKAASQKKSKGQKQNTVTKQAMPAKQNKSVGEKATGGGGLKSRSLFSRIKAFFGKK
ncbi:MAG: DEAD/DEAH box helicase [Spirochaetaceae bacterium]|nr:DEAD/DEAH box helicase [Spirochaetaceae bacterium]